MKISDLKRFEDFLSCNAAKIEVLRESKTELESRLKSLKTYVFHLNEALTVMNAVGVLNADESNKIIEEIVTETLRIVYDESYSFVVENSVQRNQPETNFYVKIGDKTYSLRNEELGGGVIDTVSFALRVTAWAISGNRSDNIMVADEPIKNLDSTRILKAGEMIKKLSTDLGLQFLIVTHSNELMDIADSLFDVKKVRQTSVVEKLH
jgi:DNA repair exonuclease SbcCD ATPase subunit